MTNADAELPTWRYRLSTLGLLLAYSVSYTTPLYVLRIQLDNALSLSWGWPCNAYNIISYALVTAALLLAVLGPRVVKRGPLRAVRIFLIVNWLPHTLCLLFAATPYSSGAWID